MTPNALLTWHVDAVVATVTRAGGTVHAARVDPPADPEALERVRTALGRSLPLALERLFLACSGLALRWTSPSGPIRAGELALHLEDLVALYRGRDVWGPPPPSPPFHPMAGVLPFARFADGSCLAVDLDKICLVHRTADDRDDVWIGHDALSVVTSWLAVGAAGPERDVWRAFVHPGGLSARGALADAVADWLDRPCLTARQAQDLVEHKLAGGPHRCRITGVEALDVGWVFSYQSEAFVRTGDVFTSLAGNAPYFVHAVTGRLTPLGTAEPLAATLRRMRADGFPA
jgi:hypothetical protein